MPMKFIARIFNPTNNRRLNELLGFLLCVSALLLFLALASYSPLDPSFNSASVLTGSRVARNWIGIVGALRRRLAAGNLGVTAFLLPMFALGLGIRWFRSRKVVSPIAKLLGGIWLLMFVPALLALLARTFAMARRSSDGRPGRTGHWRRSFIISICRRLHCFDQHAGGGAVFLHRILVLAGAPLGDDAIFVCHCLRDRWKDWQEERLRKKMQKELDKRRAAKPAVQTQMIQAPSGRAPSGLRTARTTTDRN